MRRSGEEEEEVKCRPYPEVYLSGAVANRLHVGGQMPFQACGAHMSDVLPQLTFCLYLRQELQIAMVRSSAHTLEKAHTMGSGLGGSSSAAIILISSLLVTEALAVSCCCRNVTAKLLQRYDLYPG